MGETRIRLNSRICVRSWVRSWRALEAPHAVKMVQLEVHPPHFMKLEVIHPEMDLGGHLM